MTFWTYNGWIEHNPIASREASVIYQEQVYPGKAKSTLCDNYENLNILFFIPKCTHGYSASGIKKSCFTQCLLFTFQLRTQDSPDSKVFVTLDPKSSEF